MNVLITKIINYLNKDIEKQKKISMMILILLMLLMSYQQKHCLMLIIKQNYVKYDYKNKSNRNKRRMSNQLQPVKIILINRWSIIGNLFLESRNSKKVNHYNQRKKNKTQLVFFKICKVIWKLIKSKPKKIIFFKKNKIFKQEEVKHSMKICQFPLNLMQ